MKSAEELRDQYTLAKPCLIGGGLGTGQEHTVWLKVGNQSFCLSNYQDTREEADWMRLMLGKALETILAENTN